MNTDDKFIPIKDSMPPMWDSVMLKNKAGKEAPAVMTLESLFFLEKNNITHWRPLTKEELEEFNK